MTQETNDITYLVVSGSEGDNRIHSVFTDLKLAQAFQKKKTDEDVYACRIQSWLTNDPESTRTIFRSGYNDVGKNGFIDVVEFETNRLPSPAYVKIFLSGTIRIEAEGYTREEAKQAVRDVLDSIEDIQPI